MKKRLLRLLACSCASAVLCLQVDTAEAIFASVQSTGMAATSISYPIDSLAGAYNPAGISAVGNRTDSEIGWVRDTGHATVTGNALLNRTVPKLKLNGMRTQDAYPAAFGAAKTWCGVFCNVDISAGIVFYNRNYQKTTYKHPIPLFGISNPGLEYINQTLSPIIAVRVCGRHTLGISANCQLERIKVNGLQNFNNIFRSVAPGAVTNRGYGYSRGWGVTVGYYGELTDKLSVGLTYQPKTKMDRIKKYRGFLVGRGELDVPQKIGAGIAYRFTPCLAAAFDVEHIRWKDVPSLAHKFPADSRLGDNRGPGFGFINQWYYRVGVEWKAMEKLALRLGFRHANAPIPRSQTAVNILTLDTVQDFITAGATYYVNRCSEASLVFAYGFRHKINGKNSIPVSFGSGEVDIEEQKYAIALAWAWKF